MTNSATRKYTKDHEWVEVDGSTALIGITEFAQSELGEIVFADLPEAGAQINKGQAICVLESTKAASDVYAPVSGSVVEVNAALKDDPALVNREPYEGGWLVKLEGIEAAELAGLMSAEEYAAFLA